MKYLPITACTLAALGIAHGAIAATAGTVLFAQPGTQIVSESGVARAASRGDVLQTGERLVTPAGAISQVQLTDGSLVGMRPESELKITAAASSSDNTGPVVGLLNGSARVIGAELMDGKKASNITVQSGSATVKLKGADLESAVVKADAKSTAGGTEPGSYQRLLMGSGSVANGNQVATLTPHQVSFVGAGNASPVTLNTPAQSIFGGNRTPQQSAGAGSATKGTPGAGAMASLKLNTPPAVIRPITPTTIVAPPVIAPPVKPCTRFVGKTCVP